MAPSFVAEGSGARLVHLDINGEGFLRKATRADKIIWQSPGVKIEGWKGSAYCHIPVQSRYRVSWSRGICCGRGNLNTGNCRLREVAPPLPLSLTAMHTLQGGETRPCVVPNLEGTARQIEHADDTECVWLMGDAPATGPVQQLVNQAKEFRSVCCSHCWVG